MPKSMYRAAGRAGDKFESDLVQVDVARGTSFRTSNQLKQFLLCTNCEEKFQNRGEDYFARNCYQGGGVFRLRDTLTQLSPDTFSKGRKIWHEEKASELLNTYAIKYFILSILWRHSICSVKGVVDTYRGALGPKYEEQFRCFLNEERGFPEKVQLVAYVDHTAEVFSFLGFPSRQKTKIFGAEVIAHTFSVPGFKISTLVGGPTDRFKKVLPTDISFHEWRSENTEYIRDIGLKTKAATPKGKFLKEMR